MIVIPMAGNSSRFFNAGYSTPKYTLPLRQGTVFDWSLRSFERLFETEFFLFITREGEDVYSFVTRRATALGIRQFEVVQLPFPTKGQADTVRQGLELGGINRDERLVIFNIDTFRPNAVVSPLPGCDGWLEVFHASGDHWSFIEIDSADSTSVTRCAEKTRISDLCCTGLYVFEASEIFLEALEIECKAPSLNELYVAPLFNHLISRGHKIGWMQVPSQEVVLAGTPLEYESLHEQDFERLFL